MNLTKIQLQSLTWPKGATHLKVTTPNGKHAVATKRSAPVSLDGIDGEWQFGVVLKEGKKDTFKALPNVVTEPAILPAPAPTDATPTEKKSKAKSEGVRTKVESLSKCAFIDTLYTSGKPMMQKDMLTVVMEKFPDANADSTMKTIKARIGHIRRAGGFPVWTPDPEAHKGKGGGHREKGAKRLALDAILAADLDVEKAKPAALKAIINALRAAYAPTPAPEPAPAPAA